MAVGRSSWNLSVSVRGVSRDQYLSFRRKGVRLGLSAALTGILLLGINDARHGASAEGEARTLSFLHLHTRETITVTFKRDGRYDDAALKKLNWFLRDWRRDEDIKMDPRLFDILWEVNREVGGKQPIEIISAYRAPGTNAMLRARSNGVAENSNHTHGQAIDFEIPGVPLAKIREVGLRLQRGGVGFYPTSGSPFVHLDTGSIRHWPRMTRDQLVKVFPDERTVHIPSDGQPLSGYALALAEVQRRGNAPSAVIMAQARDAGVSEAAGTASSAKPGNLLAALFGGRPTADELTDDAEASGPAKPPVVLASAASNVKPKPVVTASIVPLPSSRPRLVQVAAAEPAPAATAPNVIAAARTPFWTTAVASGDLAPPVAQSPFIFADTMTTASTGALAYAAEPTRTANTQLPQPRPAKTPPMGSNIPAAPPAALLAAAPAAASPQVAASLAGGGGRTDSPWLRAAMLTPDLATFMTATYMGERDMTRLGYLFHKPAQALVMTFSADPSLGLVTHAFTGRAVTFLATATFTSQTTASLR